MCDISCRTTKVYITLEIEFLAIYSVELTIEKRGCLLHQASTHSNVDIVHSNHCTAVLLRVTLVSNWSEQRMLTIIAR